MVTYEYLAVNYELRGEIQVASKWQGLLNEFKKSQFNGYIAADPMAFIEWLGQRGWRLAHIVQLESTSKYQPALVTWWMERASAHYCESCGTAMAAMDGLRQITGA